MALNQKSADYSFAPYKLKSVVPLGNIRYGYPVPKPRSGHRCVANNSDLYCFGGFNPQLPRGTPLDGVDWSVTRPLFRELWKFNFATKCWTKMKITGTVPTKLASHSSVLHGNSLLTFGGTGVPFGNSSSNKLYVCDLKTLEWQEVAVSGEPPQEQYGQAVALKDNRLFVVGGTSGFEYTIDVHCLNLKTNEWRALHPINVLPPPRYRHEIAFVGDVIYVFGGGTADTCFAFKTIHTFNTKTCIWSPITTYPDPDLPRLEQVDPAKGGYPEKRRCHSLVQKGTEMQVFAPFSSDTTTSGKGADGAATKCSLETISSIGSGVHVLLETGNVFIYGGFNGLVIFSDFWRLNTDTHCWRRINAKVMLPTYFHSAALTPKGCMFVYGGVRNIDRNVRTSEVFSVWLTIPKLKDISWEAVLHYHQDWINASPKASLLKEGIPREYVESVEMQAECG